jgi:UDP-glucose 4-epimerase
MSTCLVTGGCGFIGRHLVKALVDLKHNVFIVDTNTKAFKQLSANHKNCINNDVAEMNEFDLEQGMGFDVIFHLAAVSRTVPAIEYPIECIRTNVLGTACILEAAKQAKVPRVVVSSSNVVLAGQTPYRDSKRCVEDMCLTYGTLYDQSVIALRYSNVYGSGIPIHDPAVFAMLRDSYNERGYAEVTGDGEQTRDFTHVSDIVQGNIAAWKSNYRGVVNLCTERQTSINQACELLSIPVKHIQDRPGDVKFMLQEANTAKKVLSWEAKVKLEDGIKDIWLI